MANSKKLSVFCPIGQKRLAGWTDFAWAARRSDCGRSFRVFAVYNRQRSAALFSLDGRYAGKSRNFTEESIVSANSGTEEHMYGPQGDHRPRRNGFGVAALVLGILAVLTFWTVFGGIACGVLAVVFGALGFRRKVRGEATNGAMAVVGGVIGLISLIVSSILLAAGLTFLNSDEVKSYSECMEHAGGKSDRDQCAKDFDRDIRE
ncbi:DUF4190 domain-containing protein [Streptomyces sp. NPDC096080]|uniref:DUF4190 domain-containing protein n=1 Tax=Streptomyces sp. NPDC096080 TaxID=3156693 RepID=UPI00331DEBB4